MENPYSQFDLDTPEGQAAAHQYFVTCERHKQDKFIKCKAEIILSPELSYEEYVNRFESVISKTNSHEFDAWEYYKEIYDSIPIKYRLRIMLETIYTKYTYDHEELLEYLEDICNNETQEMFDARVSKVREALGDMVDSRDIVSVYRGITDESLDSDYALSWTYNRDVAFWFASRFANTSLVSNPKLLTGKVPITHILAVSNDRNEHEVIVLPPAIGGILSIVKSDSVEYDELFMRKHKDKEN